MSAYRGFSVACTQHREKTFVSLHADVQCKNGGLHIYRKQLTLTEDLPDDFWAWVYSVHLVTGDQYEEQGWEELGETEYLGMEGVPGCEC